MRPLRLTLSIFVFSCIAAIHAQSSTSTTQAVPELISKIDKLANLLAADQKSSLLLAFDAPARLEFNYLPGERAGMGFRDLSGPQEAAALDVLRAALSAAGFEKEESVRALDDILHDTVSTQRYHSGRYFLAVFGRPSVSAAWAMRMEGHHMSLNWTFAGGKVVAVTPQFLGANPAEVRSGPLKGKRTLAAEEDLGRQLAKSLSAEQARAGILDGNPSSSILSRLESKMQPRADEGIPYPNLSADQQSLLLALIETYLGVQRPEVARERLQRIKTTGLDKIRFTWMGSLEPGQGHYYRIQGPTFIVEYENSQNEANHVHSGWRDFQDDYGRDPLAEHLARDHTHN